MLKKGKSEQTNKQKPTTPPPENTGYTMEGQGTIPVSCVWLFIQNRTNEHCQHQSHLLGAYHQAEHPQTHTN